MKKNKRGGLKCTLAAVVFCAVLGAGTLCSAEEGKVVAAGAYIRAAADASSAQLASIKQGDKVDVISKTVGSDGKNWYQVWINGVDKGFIRADLVDVKDDSSIATLKNSDAAANTTPAAETPSNTTATPTDARRATVSTNGTRIRKGASTNDDVIATANRGMVLTVTGEANGADGKVWYQVTFTYNDREITGFIRSDLVTFDEVSPDEAVSNITGTEEGGEQPQTDEQPSQEEQPQEAQPEENVQQPTAVQVVTPMNTDEKPYIMPGFILVDLKVSEEEKVKAWNYNDYIICYADVNGVQDWYLIENYADPQNCVVQKYAYADITENPDGSSGNILPIAVLAVIIVILLAVIGVMFLKLRDSGDGYDDDDDDDDYYGDDEIDELEDEEEDFSPTPARRPQTRPMPQQRQGQPQRRPAPQQGQESQPQRRPAPQQGQPQRRPTSQPQGQPQRRPAPQQPSDNDMRRRPEGDGRVVTKPNNQKQGGQAPQRKNPQGQRGKTKNSSGNGQNNDMDFIDI